MAQDSYAHDDYDSPDAAERVREAATEHPGATALVSLLSSPIALKAGGVALRWARRNPVLAIVVAAGAYVWWSRRNRASDPIEGYAEPGGGRRSTAYGDREPESAPYGNVNGRETSGAARRRDAGDATSIASSL